MIEIAHSEWLGNQADGNQMPYLAQRERMMALKRADWGGWRSYFWG
jgi:hypothetical protein